MRPRGYGHCHGCYGKWSKTDTWLGGKPRGRPRGRPRGYGNCHGCDGKWSKTDTWLGGKPRGRPRGARLASRLWTLPWMRWKVEKNRHLARRQAARQASRQASRLWKLQQRRDLARMRQARPRGYGNCSKGETYLAIRQASRPVEAMESAIDAIESGAKQTLTWLG